MDVDVFLKSKEVEKNNEIIIKKVIKSKQHKIIAMTILNASPENQTLIDYVIKGYEDFKKHKALMKNNKILFEDFFKDKNKEPLKCFENFNDTVQKTILHNNAHKLKNRIISKKHEHLCNDGTEKIFLEMAHMDFTRDEIQKFIGKKISAFHHPEELNGALLNLVEIKSNWSPEEIINKLEEKCSQGIDYNIAFNKDKKLIVDILSFKGSTTIGSKMWCIAREEQMYKHYKEESHIDYKYLFDFNKEPSDDMSMIAFLTNAEANIDTFWSKDDKELSNDSELRFEYSNLLKTAYPELTFVDKINKIRNNKDIKENSLKDQKFDPTNEDHMWTILQEFSNYDLKVSKEEMDNNPDVFDTSNMRTRDFSLVRDSEMEQYLENEFSYSDDMKSFLNKKNFSKDAFTFLFKDDSIKKLFTKSWCGFSQYLLENKRYEETTSFLQDADTVSKLSSFSTFGKTESFNIFFEIAKNKEMIGYLKDHNEDFVNNLFQDIKAKVDIENGELKRRLSIEKAFKEVKGQEYDCEDTYNREKLDVYSYINTALIKCRKNETVSNLKNIIPEINDYKSDFSGFDYTKSLFLARFNMIAKDAISHFDFSGEKDVLAKVFTKRLLENIIPQEYNHPKKDFEKFEKNYEDAFNFIQHLDDNETISIEKENTFFNIPERTIKNNIFTKNTSDSDIISGLNNIHIYDLTGDKGNSQKSLFKVLINLGEKYGMDKNISLISLLEKSIQNEKYAHSEKREITDLYSKGLTVFITGLNEAGFLNKNGFDKFVGEQTEKYKVLDVAKEAIRISDLRVGLKRTNKLTK